MNERVAIVGPVFPYRAGIAYCTTRLAEELAKSCDVSIISFKRQYPRAFYPGGDDIDETLLAKTPANARFVLDILNPWTWLRAALDLRRSRPDAVIFVWWIWVWALPYRLLLALLPRSTRVVLQCHNVGDKEPAWWKSLLTNGVLRRADALIVHARSEAEEVTRRLGRRSPSIHATFLPVHELGGPPPTRADARAILRLPADANLALFFGHVRPFKGLDIAIRAWAHLDVEAILLVAGEAWWKGEEEYRRLARELGVCFVQRDEGRGTWDEGRETSALCHPERSEGSPWQEPGPARLPGDPSPSARLGMTRFSRPSSIVFDFRFIPDAEIATWFAACDVVLAPYRLEAQSGVALTAFHFDRPVIATRVGGLPEIIEDGINGMLVPPEDPAALARAVSAFFAHSDRAAMEEAAAASARKYSWEEYGALVGRLARI